MLRPLLQTTREIFDLDEPPGGGRLDKRGVDQYLQIVLIIQTHTREVDPMARKKTEDAANTLGGCCRVESLVSVDERGQMVLPKDVRERAGIRPGDKLALATWQGEGDACCIFLIKTEMLTGLLRSVLGPALKALSGP